MSRPKAPKPTSRQVDDEADRLADAGLADLGYGETELTRLAELGTRDPILVARARYGEDRMLVVSSGEMGSSVFVRSVAMTPMRLPVCTAKSAIG